jgi:proteasome lid subunit RPN8/RPN11
MKSLLDQMLEHAREFPSEEVCGLVISTGVKSVALRGSNIARNRLIHFDLDPEVFFRVPEGWEVIASYHSHPLGIVMPSEADKAACEATAMPMHIVAPGNGDHYELVPCGYKVPYLKRPYVLGVHDCWSLIKDWYQQEMGIELNGFMDERELYTRGEDVYVRNIEKAGFVDIGDMPVEHGDLMLIQIGPKGPNHGAIWLQSGRILHHVVDRVSKEDHWAGYWAQHLTHHLRHTRRL